jgi:low temperature requirement protein LtrA
MSEPRDEGTRVSTLELFFDLVFVFTITQLTTVLFVRPTALGLLQVALMLGGIWWMYGGYAWLTNAVAPDRAARRLLLLAGMAAFLVLALTIPRAFSGSGVAFGLAYLVVVAIHAGLFTRTSSEQAVRAILRIAPFNLGSALLVLLAGALGGTAEYVVWALAVALEWATPRLAGTGGFELAPAHFVERHGLVILIALGESVVAVGMGTVGVPVGTELVGVAVLGLALSACLWWLYFGGDDDGAERALTDAAREARPQLALYAFGYWHLFMLLGIVAVASAVRRATAHPLADLALAPALALAGGVALFLLGDVLFRHELGLGSTGWRAAAAALALATIPLGTTVAAAAQLAALVGLLVAAFAVEYLTSPRQSKSD